MKMTAFWNIAPSSLFEVDRRFRGVDVLNYLDLNIEEIALGCGFCSINLFVQTNRFGLGAIVLSFPTTGPPSP
jgi:hypothetical protein